MNSTPSHPPISARKKTRQYSVFSEKPMKISAGKVKITPAATDSPAEPVVCTMLFSRIVDLPNARRMEIDSTEIGIDAETVSPARKPDVHGNRAEQRAENRAQNHRAPTELRQRARLVHVRTKLRRRRRRTPGFIGQETPPRPIPLRIPSSNGAKACASSGRPALWL